MAVIALLPAGTTALSAEELPGDPPAFQDVAEERVVTAIALRAVLQTPHFDMPDAMLTPAQADDVISYILSLRAE